MTHCRSANVELRSCWMLGSATFTMVMSSSSMNVPRQTAASVHHFGSVDVRLAVVERVLTPPSSRYAAAPVCAGRVESAAGKPRTCHAAAVAIVVTRRRRASPTILAGGALIVGLAVLAILIAFLGWMGVIAAT